MICPKCQNVMKTVDKNGIHIDQCEGCRGIFLDRGELEQIVGAENAYYGQAAAPPPYQPGAEPIPPVAPRPAAPMPPPGYAGGYKDSPRPYGGRGYSDSPRPYGGRGYSDSPRPYGGRGYSDSPRPYGGHRGGYSDSPRPYGHKGHRRRSFLENLFD